MKMLLQWRNYIGGGSGTRVPGATLGGAEMTFKKQTKGRNITVDF